MGSYDPAPAPTFKIVFALANAANTYAAILGQSAGTLNNFVQIYCSQIRGFLFSYFLIVVIQSPLRPDVNLL